MKTVRSKGGKLQLAKETLRALTPGELDGVAGGTTTSNQVFTGGPVVGHSFQIAACGTIAGTDVSGSVSMGVPGACGSVVLTLSPAVFGP